MPLHGSIEWEFHQRHSRDRETSSDERSRWQPRELWRAMWRICDWNQRRESDEMQGIFAVENCQREQRLSDGNNDDNDVSDCDSFRRCQNDELLQEGECFAVCRGKAADIAQQGEKGGTNARNYHGYERRNSFIIIYLFGLVAWWCTTQ